MVDAHRAPVVHVEHLKVDKSSNHSNGSNNRNKQRNQSSSCASVPLPTRSTRDLSIHNTSAHRQRNQASFSEKKYDTVQVTAVTEKDFANQNYQERLSHYASSMGNSNDKSSDDAPCDPDSDELVQLLAMQVYHLPGNNWCQDWWQYMANNHPVFGICCHYKLHPIGYKTRIVALIGTVLFGLAMTNAFYLFYLWNPEFDRIVAEFVTANGDTIVLTTGMLLLWTLGGGIHCALNLFMWHLAACACCRSGGCCESCACCPSLGKKMLLMFVLGILALCIMIILLRVAINGQQDSLIETEEVTVSESDKGIDIQIDDQLDLEVQSASEFSFVAGYLVEMVLSLFIYYPIGGTILFSGIMACGFKIPVLGGRPYEVYSEEKRMAKQSGGSGVLRSTTDRDVEQPRSSNRNSVKASLT